MGTCGGLCGNGGNEGRVGTDRLYLVGTDRL